MGAELRRTELAEGILLLSKLSAYLDELGKNESASWIRKVMHDLQEGPSRKREVEICRNLVESLNNGPGRIPDLYFASLGGKPDIPRTNDYLETIRAVRRFARHRMPPWSLFIV